MRSVLCVAQCIYLPVVARCIMGITVRAGALARCYDGFRNLLANDVLAEKPSGVVLIPLAGVILAPG